MAGEADGPIIIGSDDEFSDHDDDVVFTKIEIEVDSEDVIFLSETKPPPKVESDVNSMGDASSNEAAGLDTSTTCGGLTRSTSVTTETGRLSLEDEVKTTDSGSVGNSNTVSGVPGPLDLSAKQSSNHSNHDMNKCDFSLDKMVNQNPVDSFLDMALGSSTSFTSVLADLQAAFKAEPTSVAPVTEVNSPKQNVQSADPTLKVNITVSSSCNDTGLPKGCINSELTAVSSSASISTDQVNLSSLCKDKEIPMTSVGGGTSMSVPPSGQATSVITHSSIAGSSMMTHTSMAGSTISSSVPCTTSSVSSASSGTSTGSAPISSPSRSDPFAASHMLLSSLDSPWSTDLQSQPVFHPSSTSFFINPGSQFGLQTCSYGQQQNQTGLGDNFVNNMANCVGGLPGGSATSLSSNPLKRSLSSSDKMCMYNSLTLPLAMQTPQIKHSSSMCSLIGQGPSGAGSNSGPKPSRLGTHPQRPPYLFSDSAIPLPPKKQKRCFSHEGPRRLICTNCTALLDGEEFSQCPNGHSTCAKCLKERVKLVLSGKEKESIKCLNRHCDSFYPMSELKLTLPPFVVEILEEKLDSEMIADMFLKNNSAEPSVNEDIEERDDPSLNVESEIKTETFLKKYEDMPDHWDAMAEKVVSKNGYELVKLEHTSNEYQDVVAKFFESMVDSNVEVVSLHRVQNPIQWKYYTVKKAEMTRDNEGFGCVEEQQLFHGTNSSVVEAICRKGFDWRLCGKHGTMYGQGSYFAVNASYSHQYTDLRQSKKMSMGSTMMTANPFSMTLPTQPSLIYPPVNINFGQLPVPMGTQNSAFSVLNLSQSTPPTPTGLPQSSNIVNQSGANVSKNSAQSNSTNSNIVFPSTSSGISKYCRLGPFKFHSHSGNQSGNTSTSHPGQGTSQTGQTGHQKVCKLRVNPRPAHIRQVSGLPGAMMSSKCDVIESQRPTAKLFLAKVLVGKYVGGESKYRKPPPLEPKLDPFGKCYDSCVDDIRNPKIFVIFDSAQAYPEYLLEYRLCEKNAWI